MHADLLATAAAGVSNGKLFWYMTRSTGTVAMILLTIVVVLGTLSPQRAESPRWPRFAISTLHRDLSLLAIAFTALHVATTVLDGYAPINFFAAVVPFASAYRTLWLTLGTVAFDLLLALVITSLVRARLGLRYWRWIHWLAYVCWPLAIFHGVGTGSDGAQLWLLAVTAACVSSVLIAVLLRIEHRQQRENAGAWFGLSFLTAVMMLALVVLGPLQPNWAKRAGTPASLLGHPVAAVVLTHPGATTATAPTLHAFTARVTGTVRQSAVRGGALIDIRLALRGGGGGTLRIRLAGQPLQGGGISLVGSQVDLLQTAASSILTGQITSLDGTHMTAQVVTPTGGRLNLDANLQVNQSAGTVTGLLVASPA